MNPLLALVDWIMNIITAPSKLKRWEAFEKEFQDITYNSCGMGCGLEDRGITDRYDAMKHGWEKAMDCVSEIMPENK